MVSYTPLIKFSSGSCENSLGFDSNIDLKEHNEIEAFNGMLEGVENTLAAFEKRCKKTAELFDEWNCVFIMYACLRKYCNKTNINYCSVFIHDVLNPQWNLEKKGGGTEEHKHFKLVG